MAKASKATTRKIALDQIDEPKGIIRLEIDPGELEDLAESIREVGLLQPIIVRPDSDRFEIVFGHRRYLAHRLLEARKIDCIVRVLSDVECALARAAENLQRVGLSPIEEAAIYGDLRDNHGLSYDQIGKRMGKSPGVVRRRLDLLKMPPQLQKAVHKKEISFSVAEELWSLGDISDIDYYLAFAIENGAKREVVRGWVKDCKDAKRRAASAGGEGSPPPSPMEPSPVYMPCDVCRGPMELGTETTIRSCPNCSKLISEAIKGA